MIVAESRRTRRLVGRLDKGVDVLEGLAEVCRLHRVRSAEVRAQGAFDEALTEFDLAAIKQVKVSGESRAELRVEVFNLFNRVNFTSPASNRSVATFGTITGTFPARQVQLGVKFIW